MCIGSDSNVRIDPLEEELRELEGIARRRTLRGTSSRRVPPLLWRRRGAASLGLSAWPDVEVDLGHASLAGIEASDVFGALVFGCSADVFVH